MNLKLWQMRNLFFLFIFFFSVSAHSETVEILSGTGFYVSPEGHVLTNEHVVQNCKSIHLRSNEGTVDAILKAVDAENDLALLEANKKPYYVASLRYEQNLKPGDTVTVIGFPLENGKVDDYVMRTANVIDTKGPTGQAGWLQFSHALEHGNSGGPLLDQYGNVIGVVRGRASFVQVQYEELPDGTKHELGRGAEQTSDIAINLPIVTHFLQNNFVNYSNMLNFQPLSDQQKFDAGLRYIVNVQCVQ